MSAAARTAPAANGPSNQTSGDRDTNTLVPGSFPQEIGLSADRLAGVTGFPSQTSGAVLHGNAQDGAGLFPHHISECRIMAWQTMPMVIGPVLHDCTMALRGNGKIFINFSQPFLEKAGIASGDRVIVQRGDAEHAGKLRLIKGAGGYSLFGKKRSGGFSFTNWPDKPKTDQKVTPVDATVIGQGIVEIRLPAWLTPQKFEDIKQAPRRVA